MEAASSRPSWERRVDPYGGRGGLFGAGEASKRTFNGKEGSLLYSTPPYVSWSLRSFKRASVEAALLVSCVFAALTRRFPTRGEHIAGVSSHLTDAQDSCISRAAGETSFIKALCG